MLNNFLNIFEKLPHCVCNLQRTYLCKASDNYRNFQSIYTLVHKSLCFLAWALQNKSYGNVTQAKIYFFLKTNNRKQLRYLYL